MSKSERQKIQDKLDKQRSQKWRQEVQRLENKPFDVTFCHDEAAILRERWKIFHEEKFGSGDYWIFVKATFPDDAREYGVKIITLKSAPPYVQNQLKQKNLKTLAALQSPKFYHVRQSYITNDGKVYLFLDLVGYNKFLAKNLNSYPKESRELKVKIWTKTVADGLTYLHGMGVAFGHNLTADSLVLDSKDTVKVFGLESYHCAYTTSGSKVLCEAKDSQTQYLAPEVVTGKHDEIDSDIFRLGVIIYYLLTDSYPFNNSQDPKELEQQMASKTWDNGQITNPDCKSLLATIFVAEPVMRANIDEIVGHKWFKV